MYFSAVLYICFGWAVHFVLSIFMCVCVLLCLLNIGHFISSQPDIKWISTAGRFFLLVHSSTVFSPSLFYFTLVFHSFSVSLFSLIHSLSSSSLSWSIFSFIFYSLSFTSASILPLFYYLYLYCISSYISPPPSLFSLSPTLSSLFSPSLSLIFNMLSVITETCIRTERC